MLKINFSSLDRPGIVFRPKRFLVFQAPTMASEDRVSSVTSSEDLGFDVNDVNESSQEDTGSPTILRDPKERNYPPTLQISKLLDGDSGVGVDVPRKSLHTYNYSYQFVQPEYSLCVNDLFIKHGACIIPVMCPCT